MLGTRRAKLMLYNGNDNEDLPITRMSWEVNPFPESPERDPALRTFSFFFFFKSGESLTSD